MNIYIYIYIDVYRYIYRYIYMYVKRRPIHRPRLGWRKSLSEDLPLVWGSRFRVQGLVFRV